MKKLCLLSIHSTQGCSHYWGALPENVPQPPPCPFPPLGSRTCRVKWLKVLWHWYLFPWASWRVKHWRRRKGSQWAVRRPLGGADTLTAVSRRGSGPPGHAAPRQGPAAHRWPALGHSLHSAAGQDSRRTGCPPEGQAGSGTGSNKRSWMFTLEPVWLTYPWGATEAIPAGHFWGWNSNLWWWILWSRVQSESQNH